MKIVFIDKSKHFKRGKFLGTPEVLHLAMVLICQDPDNQNLGGIIMFLSTFEKFASSRNLLRPAQKKQPNESHYKKYTMKP
jgi:hypothetical protein